MAHAHLIAPDEHTGNDDADALHQVSQRMDDSSPHVDVLLAMPMTVLVAMPTCASLCMALFRILLHNFIRPITTADHMISFRGHHFKPAAMPVMRHIMKEGMCLDDEQHVSR